MRGLYLNANKAVCQYTFISLLVTTLIIISFSVYVWIDLYNNVQIVDYSTTNTYILTSTNKQLTILGRTYNIENDINNVKVEETISCLTLNDRWYMGDGDNQKIEYKSSISYSISDKIYNSNYIIADEKNTRDELTNKRCNLYFEIIPVYLVIIFVLATVIMGFIYFLFKSSIW